MNLRNIIDSVQSKHLEPACNAGEPGLIPGLGRFPEGGHDPLQYSCLENSMDRGAQLASVHGMAKSDTTE